MSTLNMIPSTFLEDSGSCAWFAGYFFSGADVGFAGGNVEERETDVFYMGAGRQSFDNGANCDCSGLVNRITEGSGRDRREGQGFYSMIIGGADGLTIATGEGCGLVLLASSIHRADGVNDIFGGQSSAGGDDGFAGGESADLGDDALALLQDRRAAGAVNGSIHASATEQRGVGGVDDGFGGLLGDVGGAVEFERLTVRESQSGCEVGHSG